MMLKGKTSVITGCNRGIGLSTLKILLKMAQIFLHVAERFPMNLLMKLRNLQKMK